MSDVCVTLRIIQIWCKSIREGNFTLTPTPGRPRMTSSEAKVRRVQDILEVNPRMGVREIVDNLSLPRLTVHRITKAHLKFRNVYSVCVPHVLSDDNKRKRIQCCSADQCPSFLGSHYLVQDESWIPWDFEDNWRVLIATTAVKPTTPCPKLTPQKKMVIVAYTSQPTLLSLTLLPQGATVNSEITKKFLDDTWRRFRQLQGAPTNSPTWCYSGTTPDLTTHVKLPPIWPN